MTQSGNLKMNSLQLGTTWNKFGFCGFINPTQYLWAEAWTQLSLQDSSSAALIMSPSSLSKTLPQGIFCESTNSLVIVTYFIAAYWASHSNWLWSIAKVKSKP